MDQFKLAIVGPKEFNDYEKLKAVCEQVLSNKFQTHEVVILYGSYGPFDKLVTKYSSEKGLFSMYFAADWKKEGNTAYYLRANFEVDTADAILIFDDGLSKGINIFKIVSQKKGIPTRILNV